MMNAEWKKDIVDFIKMRATDTDDIVQVLIALESEYDIRIGVVTRGDVEDEFHQAWLFDGEENRQLTDAEWEEFSQDWFWLKGHSEVFWDGNIVEAIRYDLRDRGLLPKGAVV
jgi:hypothetical protein